MMRHTIVLLWTVLAAALLATGDVLAQAENTGETRENDNAAETAQDDQSAEAQDDQQDAEAEAGDEAEEWTVPATFDPLFEEFLAIARDFRDAGRVLPAQRPAVRELREKVSQYNQERTPTERSLAVELQLVKWAGEEAGEPGRAVYERFDDIDITSPGLRVAWAEHLEAEGHPIRAIQVLDEGDVDLAKYPRAGIIRAEALVVGNHFEEASIVLDSIPLDSIRDGQVLDDIYRLRQLIASFEPDWAKEQAVRELEAQADDLPRVEIVTSKGAFVVELYENQAPNTVANFISLVEEGFYNGMPFDQVLPGNFVSVGDPAQRPGATGVLAEEGIGYTIADEIPEDGSARAHFAGVLSMERRLPDTAASEFIITLRQRLDRDGRYTAFGRVIDGMRVVRNLNEDDQVIEARVLRKRDHPYEVEKILPAEEEQETADEADGNASDETAGEDAEAADDDTENSGDADADAADEDADTR